MEKDIFFPANQQEWRDWLEIHHSSEPHVWLGFYNKKAERQTITWSEAVDVALCYGWIDSTKHKLDEFSSAQYFCRRKAKSTWSKVNKDKVETLIQNGLMREAGLKSVEIAQENGSWTSLDSIENLEIPHYLNKAFKRHPHFARYFEGLSKSNKKMLLYDLMQAKREETRLTRIEKWIEKAK